MRNWQQVDALFGLVLDLPADERVAFLKQEADAELREEVLALVAAAEEAERHFDCLDFGSELFSAALAKNNGENEQSVGAYRLDCLLGYGATGTVYLASRSDGAYRRQAAIKILRLGVEHGQLLRRFERERHILAELEHPNIAGLYDAGTTRSGQPYLVMEYVDGLPLDEYCDRHRLPIEERLVLLRKVCDAVHYAHQNLLIHRDLKPYNILVTDEGEPKLLDFGIAKPLSTADPAFELRLTRTGLQPMTVPYASPEQVGGQILTTASDVYTLGVLIFELTCGHRPFEPRPGEPLEQQIRGGDFPRPSRSVRDLAPDLGRRIAENRGLQQEELARRLAGDLDHIILMAMRQEPGQRYASAEQLGEDLSRHLERLPVRAQFGSWGYRLSKFVHRHWLAVAATVGFVLVGVAFLSMVLLHSQRLAEEREVADVERDKARLALDFLVDVFRVAEPSTEQEPTAREILNAGARRIGEEWQGQPEVQATLLGAIGQAYSSLGRFDEASPLLNHALDLRQNAAVVDPLAVAVRAAEKINHPESPRYRIKSFLLLAGRSC